MVQSDIPISSSAEAAVNAPPSGDVTLYDAAGRVVIVAQGDVGHWLAQGFTRYVFDAQTATSATMPLALAAAGALNAAIAAVVAAGELDTSAEAPFAVAVAAASDFAHHAGNVLAALQGQYPVAQEHGLDAVRMVLNGPDGQPLPVLSEAGTPETVEDNGVTRALIHERSAMPGEVAGLQAEGWVIQ